jgi:hypothetical protein
MVEPWAAGREDLIEDLATVINRPLRPPAACPRATSWRWALSAAAMVRSRAGRWPTGVAGWHGQRLTRPRRASRARPSSSGPSTRTVINNTCPN